MWNEGQVEYLKNFGLNIKLGHYVFQIEENDIYFQLKGQFDRWGVSDWVGTAFDKSDLKNSDYLSILSKWFNDYPQPENNYLEASYDLSNYCSACGAGKVQKAPLRLKKEPNWGKKQTFSLNWIFDEIFVRKEYYERMFKPLGVESIEVKLHKKDIPSESTVQLKIPISNSELELSGCTYSECETCRRKKYFPVTKGFFPKLTVDVTQPIFKTQEYFGSGVAADKKLMISQELYQILASDKANLTYYPQAGVTL